MPIVEMPVLAPYSQGSKRIVADELVARQTVPTPNRAESIRRTPRATLSPASAPRSRDRYKERIAARRQRAQQKRIRQTNEEQSQTDHHAIRRFTSNCINRYRLTRLRGVVEGQCRLVQLTCSDQLNQTIAKVLALQQHEDGEHDDHRPGRERRDHRSDDLLRHFFRRKTLDHFDGNRCPNPPPIFLLGTRAGGLEPRLRLERADSADCVSIACAAGFDFGRCFFFPASDWPARPGVSARRGSRVRLR